MLDVHPPHQAAHTWRDFLIHIATIVVGLLIAIGLEQTVEFFHHRRELREAKEALSRERGENAEQFSRDTDYLAYNVSALRNNLLVLLYLRAHPGTLAAKLPGVLTWSNLYSSMSDLAWRGAQSSNVVQLMPREEASSYAELYEALVYMNQLSEKSWEATSRALMFSFADPDATHLTPAQLDHEIELIEEALETKYRLGVAMGNVGKAFPDFSHAPSLESLQNLTVAAPPPAAQQLEMRQAIELTKARMARTPLPKQ